MGQHEHHESHQEDGDESQYDSGDGKWFDDGASRRRGNRLANGGFERFQKLADRLEVLGCVMPQRAFEERVQGSGKIWTNVSDRLERVFLNVDTHSHGVLCMRIGL